MDRAYKTFSSPEDTCRFARSLTARLGAGDCILLSGPVGAGKTHFTRCAIKAMLVAPEEVPSPTYTLVQIYETPRFEIWHADLYRLYDPTEIEELGLSDAFVHALCFVEWPEVLGAQKPADALDISIEEGDDEESRILRFDWSSPAWASKLEGLVDVRA